MPPVWPTNLEMGPTRILTAAIWLKMSKKYFNEGTAKEVCEHFDVRAKQLLRVLTGKKCLGGTQAPQAQGHRGTTSQTEESGQLSS